MAGAGFVLNTTVREQESIRLSLRTPEGWSYRSKRATMSGRSRLAKRLEIRVAGRQSRRAAEAAAQLRRDGIDSFQQDFAPGA